MPSGIENDHIIVNGGHVRYYHMPVESFDPGASGATWVDPDANTIGGYNITAATHELLFEGDIHSDWNGTGDISVEIEFEKNTAGGAGGDTVDIRIISYYKGVGDSATKTQTQEEVTVVGADAQYTMYRVTFAFDPAAAGNLIDAGDTIRFVLNLETDTSECDNIIINSAAMYYPTTHLGIETGDT